MLWYPCGSFFLGVGAHATFLNIPVKTLTPTPTPFQSCFCKGSCISLYMLLQMGTLLISTLTITFDLVMDWK